MHIELIDHREKIARDLGGFGEYRQPTKAASIHDLLIDARLRSSDSLNTAVWKVARRSVGWDRGPYRRTRLLRVGSAKVPCRLLGGERNWYFVAVDAADAVRRLSPAAREAQGTDRTPTVNDGETQSSDAGTPSKEEACD